MLDAVHLLADPVQIDFFYLHFLKIREILNPVTNFNLLLALFFLEQEDLNLKGLENESQFDLIRVRCYLDEDFKDLVLKSLELFTKEVFIFENDNFILTKNSIEENKDSITYILTEKHWEKIKDYLILENNLNFEKKEEEYTTKDPRVIEIKKRIAENKKIVSKYKKSKGPDLLSLVNAFSVISSNSNLNQILDLTPYQFRNQLDQLIKTQNWDISIKSLIAGADPKKTKIVHWTENS